MLLLLLTVQNIIFSATIYNARSCVVESVSSLFEEGDVFDVIDDILETKSPYPARSCCCLIKIKKCIEIALRRDDDPKMPPLKRSQDATLFS